MDSAEYNQVLEKIIEDARSTFHQDLIRRLLLREYRDTFHHDRENLAKWLEVALDQVEHFCWGPHDEGIEESPNFPNGTGYYPSPKPVTEDHKTADLICDLQEQVAQLTLALEGYRAAEADGKENGVESVAEREGEPPSEDEGWDSVNPETGRDAEPESTVPGN